jgi:hypothetical protein
LEKSRRPCGRGPIGLECALAETRLVLCARDIRVPGERRSVRKPDRPHPYRSVQRRTAQVSGDRKFRSSEGGRHEMHARHICSSSLDSLDSEHAQTQTLWAAGIVNAASYAGGSVSPGEIVTIVGSFPGPATLVPLQLDNRGYGSTNPREAVSREKVLRLLVSPSDQKNDNCRRSNRSALPGER